MNTRAALAQIAFAAVLLTGRTVPAQTAAAPAPSAGGSASSAVLLVDDHPDRREPAVMRNLYEDGGSKIDELVVRGEVQHVVVTPKVGTSKSYEIVMQRGGRTPPDSTGGASSAVGKRVWNVLAF